MDTKIPTEIPQDFIDDLIEFFGKEKVDAGKFVVYSYYPWYKWVDSEYPTIQVTQYDKGYAAQYDKGYGVYYKVKRRKKQDRWWFGYAETIAIATREAMYSIQNRNQKGTPES